MKRGDPEYTRRRNEERMWEKEVTYSSVDERLSTQVDRWKSVWGSAKATPESLVPKRVCIVGCNLGGLEYPAGIQWENASIDAVDLVEPTDRSSWDEINRRLNGRINYYPGTDVQQSLPGKYDLVVAHSVIHHCPWPEQAAKVIAESLDDGGTLLIEEYVGGCGLSCSDLRLRVAQNIWNALPDCYKLMDDGKVKNILYRPPDARCASSFEAYASDQIEGAFKDLFDVVSETHARPVMDYRAIIWEGSSRATRKPEIDRLLNAFEEIMMSEGWLSGENWSALLVKK